MKEKKALSFCCRILSGWLAALLLTALTTLPVTVTLQKVSVPDNISDILQKMDFVKLIEENEGLQQQVESMGIPTSAVNEAMHSNVMGEVVELYMQDIQTVITGADEELGFSVDAVMGILGENIDEIVDFTQEYVPGANQMPREDLKKEVQQNLKQQSTTLTEMLPSVSDLKESTTADGENGGDLSFLQDAIVFIRTTLLPSLCVGVVVLSVVIALLQCRQLRGVRRVGITFFSAGMTTLTFTLAVEGVLRLVEHKIPVEFVGLLKPLVQVVEHGFFVFTIVYMSVAAVCMVLFWTVAYVHKRRQKLEVVGVETTQTPSSLPADASTETITE